MQWTFAAGVQLVGFVVNWPGWFGGFAIMVLRYDNEFVALVFCGNVTGAGE